MGEVRRKSEDVQGGQRKVSRNTRRAMPHHQGPEKEPRVEEVFFKCKALTSGERPEIS